MRTSGTNLIGAASESEQRLCTSATTPEIDIPSVVFRDTTVTTKELAEGIVGEYDAQDQLVGLEILDAGTRLGSPSMIRQVTLEGLDLSPTP